VDVRPLTVLLEPEMRPWRMGAMMFTAFGLVALLLTCIGIYGVVSYTAAQRTHEMGVRIALGARTGNVLSAVAREGMQLAIQGAAIGVAVVLLLQKVVEPLLFEVSPLDPFVLAGVVLALVAIAALGSVVPAWRATRIDPVVALRNE
jgi:ABC-type antimicrobial peptide transport system permease subunit